MEVPPPETVTPDVEHVLERRGFELVELSMLGKRQVDSVQKVLGSVFRLQTVISLERKKTELLWFSGSSVQGGASDLNKKWKD